MRRPTLIVLFWLFSSLANATDDGRCHRHLVNGPGLVAACDPHPHHFAPIQLNGYTQQILNYMRIHPRYGESLFIQQYGLLASRTLYNISNQVRWESNALCGSGENTADNEVDAIRHFLMSYRSYRSLGACAAEDAMFAHELNPGSRGDQNGSAMDVHNNEVAFAFARQHYLSGARLSDRELYTLALTLLMNGRLRIITPDTKSMCGQLRLGRHTPSDIADFVREFQLIRSPRYIRSSSRLCREDGICEGPITPVHRNK